MVKCIEVMTLKTEYTFSNFKPWKKKIFSQEKIITELKQKLRLEKTKPALNDPMLESTERTKLKICYCHH